MRRIDLIAEQDPATGQIFVPLWAGPAGWIRLPLYAVGRKQCEWPPGRLRVLEAMGMRPEAADLYQPADGHGVLLQG